ncbi:MAG: S1 family peptidase, partial [Actinomycetes bacterium]
IQDIARTGAAATLMVELTETSLYRTRVGAYSVSGDELISSTVEGTIPGDTAGPYVPRDPERMDAALRGVVKVTNVGRFHGSAVVTGTHTAVTAAHVVLGLRVEDIEVGGTPVVAAFVPPGAFGDVAVLLTADDLPYPAAEFADPGPWTGDTVYAATYSNGLRTVAHGRVTAVDAARGTLDVETALSYGPSGSGLFLPDATFAAMPVR